MKFLIGHKELVAEWAGKILQIKNWGQCEAVGIEKNGKIVCAVIYNNFQLDPEDKPISIEMSIASVDKCWCSRHNLKELFAYPFIQLDVKRLQATCSVENKGVRDFLSRLGFQLEGIGREAWHLGGHSAVYSMLKHECRWLNVKGRREFIGSKSIHIGRATDAEQRKLSDFPG